MAINRLEFANVLCHFGKHKVLLDYLMEIILPAFTDDTLIRRRGRDNFSEHFFYNVSLHKLTRIEGQEVIGVYGEYIKTVKLTRTQIFDPEKGLVQDVRSIKSSPSATFLFILNNHKLVYLPKTPHAPTLHEFQTTLQDFVHEKHKQFIDREYKTRNNVSEKITKKKLHEDIPWPIVNVVPLSNEDSVSDFVKRFEVLQSINFNLLRPNPVIDAGDTFKEMRSVLEGLNANSGKVVVANKDGLNKTEATKVISKANTGGNQDIVLKGVDHEGATLSGSNDDFKISVSIDGVPTKPSDASKKLFDTYKATIQDSPLTSDSVGKYAVLKALVNQIDEEGAQPQ